MRFFTAGIALLSLFLLPRHSAAQDVILQGFYWNTHLGDTSNRTTGGVWWDTLVAVAPQLAGAGFKTVWTPPANKGFAGVFDMGYGVYDYFDFGQFNQKGTTRTRHGNQAQFQAMIDALHNQNIKVMADIVLNHRAGAEETQPEDCDHNGDMTLEQRYTKFRPASNRILMDNWDFHPNFTHCDLTGPYHDRTFFEDVCYFNFLDQALDPMAANNGWYFGPHNLGKAGDSLIVWGRHLVDAIDGAGFDEVRLDAVKHVEPGFLAPFLVELASPDQPFAVGELFDGNLGVLKNYHDAVEGYNVAGPGLGSKDANLAIFDFSLRYALRDVCNGGGGYDMWNLNSSGLRFNPAGALPGEDIVTFVENHDVDRIGFTTTPCNGPGVVAQYGNTCLTLSQDSGHDPIISDKEDMGYPYIMAAEGRPTVFWKDWFWYGLDDDIGWQMALRAATAGGNSTPIASLSPFFTIGHGGDLFVLNRAGGGGAAGLVLALNDNATTEAKAFVNTPFSDKYLKDYSDGYLFQYTQAFGDTRAEVKAQKRDYAWWSVTGLYPKPAGTAASHFNMDATPGGCPHFIAIRAADAANLIVNGAPIAAGDEVAVKNVTGQVVGIGRVGQGFRWDGTHDMIVEALGSPSANGLGAGETFRLFVYDQSAGSEVEIGTVQYAASGSAFNFSPDRPGSPNRNGGFSTFSVNTTAQGAFQCGGISRVIAFNTQVAVNQPFCTGDDAAGAAYNDGWQNGDNSGSGLGAWSLSNTGSAGFFTASSTGNGNGDNTGDGDINTGGRAWGTFANSGGVANAVRAFSADLPAGAVFSLKMDNGFIDGGGTVGFGLQNASDQNLLEFYFAGGASFYRYDDATGPHDTNLGFSDEGLSLEITLTSGNTYELTATSLGSGSSGTWSGSLKNPAGGQSVNRVRLFNANAGFNSSNDAYFNSIGICYPATIVINEVDYDQVNTDNMEFVELKNVSSASVNLDAYTLQLINGGDNLVYQSVDLPNVDLAPGAYYVVCGSGSGVPNCNVSFSGASDQVQNGAPDALRLLLNNAITVDALSYEGSVAGAVEGSGTGLTDNNTTAGVGLSRVPDGNDTNQNNSDFKLTCITPGSANVDNANGDGDTRPDNCDNCPDDTNESQADTDEDGTGDACDDCPLAVDGIAHFNTATCNCDPGYFPATEVRNGETVITACQVCPAGYYCPDGAAANPCPAGTFSSVQGATACTPCGINTFNDVMGAVLCQSCGTGFYSQMAATSCSTCNVSFSATPSDESCAGEMDGAIAVSGVAGGTAPFQYSIDNGATYVAGATFTGLAAGAYQVRVKDAYGCESTAQSVTVDLGDCPVDISGAILWEHDDVSGVKDATVTLSGGASGSVITPASGAYAFSVPSGSNVDLTPAKPINKLNGITAADAARIQQHISGNTIADAYKQVAADVNKSNSITTIDATIINQSLLGNPAALAQFKTSWRFVPVAHALNVPPWGFPEKITLTNVTADATGQNFFGIKTGDLVTNFADPAGLGAPAAFALSVQDRVVTGGSEITVSFDNGPFDDLSALQFALHFDPEALELQDIQTPENGILTPDHFGTYNAADGEIRVVWSQAAGAAPADGAELFRLKFYTKTDGAKLGDLLALDASALPGYAYNGALEEHPVQLVFTATTAVQGPGTAARGARLLQNRPNPFIGSTVIGFVLPEACEAELRVVDLHGRPLKTHRAYYPAGAHDYLFDAGGDVAPGVYYCELLTPLGSAVRKMVVAGR